MNMNNKINISDIETIYTYSSHMVDPLQNILRADKTRGGITQLIDPESVQSYFTTFYMIATYNGKTVGSATIHCGHEMCELYKLYVLPEYRGHSVGATIVERVIAKMRSIGLKTMKVEAQLESKEFWNKIIQRYNIDEDSCFQNILFLL
ncbi:MAG: GNAT family N-acetyltransferase [Acetobacter sp.]|uniref:GNAT family N-acetyltransferase n=1 Tax=Acetobacter sp. TaxID=440 RepID=UPI0039EA1E26